MCRRCVPVRLRQPADRQRSRESVDVVVLRKGERQTIPVTLGRLEDGEKMALNDPSGDGEENGEPGQRPTFEAMGLTFTELTDEGREANNIAPDVQGVLIDNVAEGSMAAEKGIKPGSVVSEIGQEAVTSIDEVEERLEALRKDGRKKALLLVASGDGQLSFVVLDLT